MTENGISRQPVLSSVFCFLSFIIAHICPSINIKFRKKRKGRSGEEAKLSGKLGNTYFIGGDSQAYGGGIPHSAGKYAWRRGNGIFFLRLRYLYDRVRRFSNGTTRGSSKADRRKLRFGAFCQRPQDKNIGSFIFFRHGTCLYPANACGCVSVLHADRRRKDRTVAACNSSVHIFRLCDIGLPRLLRGLAEHDTHRSVTDSRRSCQACGRTCFVSVGT